MAIGTEDSKGAKIAQGSAIAGLILICAVILGIVLLGEKKKDDDRNYIMDGNKLIAMRDLIVGAGYVCEQVKLAWISGESPYGVKFDAECGPAISDGVYKNQVYAVYPEKLRVEVCSGGAYRPC